jgi:hypothetical protein
MVMQNLFELSLENDRWLNPLEFMEFCVSHQHQAITVKVINEGHCLRHCGVYQVLDLFEFDSVTIDTYNSLEISDRYRVVNRDWPLWLINTENFDYDFDYTWNQSRLFGCVYGRPSAPRLGIAGHLARHHDDKSFLRVKFTTDHEDDRKLFDITRLFSWDPAAVENIKLLLEQRYQAQDHYRRGHYDQSNTLSHHYVNFLIDIVAEPVCQGTSFYPTEKLSRAMLCRRPFIAMASKNYLTYLRQMGFQTFNDYWDEYYDGFDSNLRYERILCLIDHLASMTKQDWIDMYQSMQRVLDHNFVHLKNRLFDTNIKFIGG